MAFERISVDHRVMAGVPCIRGTRIPVATVVAMIAEGMPVQEILDDYPQLAAEDVAEALRYAAAAVDEQTLPLAPSACCCSTRACPHVSSYRSTSRGTTSCI